MKTRPGTLLALSLVTGYAALFSAHIVSAQRTPLPKTAPPQTEKGTTKDKPTQASVSLKKSFATVSATDALVKKALDAKDLSGAKKLADKPGAFKGKVVKVYSPKGNNLIILNFATDFKTALTAILRKENFAKFSKMDNLLDKNVLVTGKFTLYKDTPQILLTEISQIKIIK